MSSTFNKRFHITAGSTYLDIDAYACMVAMAELLSLKGEHAVAYSNAATNYSICTSLIQDGQLIKTLPQDIQPENVQYIIVDVSDPDYIKDSVPLDQVVGVYDHHVGFEEYWQNRIGENAHIEFIGAAATLIYREWKTAGLQNRMTSSTAKLLIAAILDNTLNLTSANTTSEDIETFSELCQKEHIGEEWCASYFREVQASVEADLKNALFNDVKTIRNNDILPSHVAQLCVWDACSVLENLQEIRQWLKKRWDSWLVNIIDIQHRCSYFVCDDSYHQNEIERVFGVCFDAGVAKTSVSYLRKEIIKKTRIS